MGWRRKRTDERGPGRTAHVSVANALSEAVQGGPYMRLWRRRSARQYWQDSTCACGVGAQSGSTCRTVQACEARTRGRAWSKRVANMLREVRMPPLGPSLYSSITLLYITCATAPSFHHAQRHRSQTPLYIACATTTSFHHSLVNRLRHNDILPPPLFCEPPAPQRHPSTTILYIAYTTASALHQPLKHQPHHNAILTSVSYTSPAAPRHPSIRLLYITRGTTPSFHQALVHQQCQRHRQSRSLRASQPQMLRPSQLRDYMKISHTTRWGFLHSHAILTLPLCLAK